MQGQKWEIQTSERLTVYFEHFVDSKVHLTVKDLVHSVIKENSLELLMNALETTNKKQDTAFRLFFILILWSMIEVKNLLKDISMNFQTLIETGQ